MWNGTSFGVCLFWEMAMMNGLRLHAVLATGICFTWGIYSKQSHLVFTRDVYQQVACVSCGRPSEVLSKASN